jgi:histone acetyltransferase (RNA polymerase elongator complex component)
MQNKLQLIMDYKKMAIISGTGVRNYYSKNLFEEFTEKII